MLRSALLFALTLTPSALLAQPAPSLGEQHYRAGVEAFEHAQYHAAAIEFRAAFELTNEPSLLVNLGNALASDGQRDEACTAFRRYLTLAPTAPNRTAAVAREHELCAPLAQPAQPPATQPAQPPVTQPAQPPPTVTPPTVTPRETDAPGSRTALAWTGAAVGGLGVVAAGVGLALYLDAGAQYDRCAQQGYCPESERAVTENAVAVGLLWGGGALALGGLATFLFAPRAHAHTPPRAWVLPRPDGLTLGGSF